MLRLKRSLLALILAVCCLVLAAGPALAEKRLDRIVESKIIRVGTTGDYLPFCMLENGKYYGHDVDVMQMLAKELGVEIEWVHTTWPTIMKDFHADKFDVAVGGLARTLTRAKVAELLPPYAPFGKVALMRKEHKDRFTSVEAMNQPDVRVIKNPGGTNETFALTHLSKARISTHQYNAEIPGLIAEGKGDIMITENDEAISHVKKDPRLHAGFLDKPLTPINFKGFMLQKDDRDFVRVMNYLWDLLERRGKLAEAKAKWLE
ncbi:transporter substrate-binding domain-containing protein [Desulfovibrio sp. OttesenSCG-928-C14]|nr:transporter substrate-binding domain-containing protein [Desulfovibrio sp. OttesenSCG-928-C14]